MYKKTFATMDGLVNEMQRQVDSIVLHWKSDFDIDRRIIDEHADTSSTYRWFLRTCGTHFVRVSADDMTESDIAASTSYLQAVRSCYVAYREFSVCIPEKGKGNYSISLLRDLTATGNTGQKVTAG